MCLCLPRVRATAASEPQSYVGNGLVKVLPAKAPVHGPPEMGERSGALKDKARAAPRLPYNTVHTPNGKNHATA